MAFSKRVSSVTSGKKIIPVNDLFYQNKETVKEMNRIIDIVNKRVKALSKSGYTSTALNALISERGHGTFRRIQKNELNDPIARERILYDWGRAIAFVHNPTSTVLGTKQYIKKISSQYGVSFNRANEIIDFFSQPSINSNGFLSFKYRKLLEEYKSDVMSEEKYIDYNANDWKEQVEAKLRIQQQTYDTETDSFFNSIIEGGIFEVWE